MKADSEKLNDRELLAECQDALKHLGSREWSFSIDVTMALQLASNLQLALRHPGNVGPNAAAAKLVVAQIQGAMNLLSPALGELLARGNNPQHDTWAFPPSLEGWIELIFKRADADCAVRVKCGKLHPHTTMAVFAILVEVVRGFNPPLAERCYPHTTELACQSAPMVKPHPESGSADSRD